MKILIVRLDHLGDLMLTTPLIRALARAGHGVDLIVPRAFLPLFEHNPSCRHCHGIEDLVPGFPHPWRPLTNWIRAGAYDVILLPHSSPRQLLWSSLFSGVKTRLAMRAGITGRLTFHRCLLTGPAFAGKRHYADLQLDLARAMGIATDGLALDYFPSEIEIDSIEEKLQSAFRGAPEGPLVGIHPGCAGNTCNLPSQVYGELAELLLARNGCRLVVTGTAGERALIENWPERVRKSNRVWFSQGELNLRMLGALISRLSVYVVVGTGPLHLASALKVRTVSPFCALPELSPNVWGNCGGQGIALEPPLKHCEKWRKESHGKPHCDFRGEITAEMLWRQVSELIS